jgi:hypothetical protein
MDPRWLPVCWGAGAAACALLFFGVQPWRAEFAKGFCLLWKFPMAWVLPLGLTVLDRLPLLGQTAGGLAPLSFRSVSQALLGVWHGAGYSGTGAALATAVLVAGNVQGMRRGCIKGVESVLGISGRAGLVVLILGALALVAEAALARQEVPMAWHLAVSALAMPLVGWTSAAVLAGLLLLAETEARAPEKIEGVRWLESSAAHAARLWPWALGHGLWWWLLRWLPEGWRGILSWVIVPPGVLLAFAPLVFLHVKHRREGRAGLSQAMALWRSHGWQVPAWAAVSGLIFTLWILAENQTAALMSSAVPALRFLLATVHTMVHICLTMGTLAAWIHLRTAEEPLPSRPPRSRKATPP